MRILRTLFISLFLLTNSAEAYSTDPKEFVYEMVSDVIEKLSSNNLTDEQKKLFIENLALENVDIKALGLYTLGELRKSANKEDIERYQQTFKKYFSSPLFISVLHTAIRFSSKVLIFI